MSPLSNCLRCLCRQFLAAGHFRISVGQFEFDWGLGREQPAPSPQVKIRPQHQEFYILNLACWAPLCSVLRQASYTCVSQFGTGQAVWSGKLTLAWWKVMAAYHEIYDWCHLQTHWKETGISSCPTLVIEYGTTLLSQIHQAVPRMLLSACPRVQWLPHRST